MMGELDPAESSGMKRGWGEVRWECGAAGAVAVKIDGDGAVYDEAGVDTVSADQVEARRGLFICERPCL